MSFPLRVAAPVVLTALLASCGDGSQTTSTSGARVTARTLLSDSPFPYDALSRVDLYVVSVSASLSADTSASSGSFVTLATPNRRINVLALANGATDQLGLTQTTTGAISAVRMVIDTDSSSVTLSTGQVLTGTTNPGIQWQSSAGRPTLNALVLEQILVPDTGATVVVDFDVGQAFIPNGAGFIFSPVIRAADANRTGSIAGTVRAHTASGAAVANASVSLYLGNPSTAENTWSRLATAKSDSTGAFRVAFVTPSAHWGTIPAHAADTYLVAIDPPAALTATRVILPSVLVTARTETPLGTVVLP